MIKIFLLCPDNMHGTFRKKDDKEPEDDRDQAKEEVDKSDSTEVNMEMCELPQDEYCKIETAQVPPYRLVITVYMVHNSVF